VEGWDERALARLAGAQDGVVTVGQLELSPKARRTRLAQQRLIRLYEGVYAVGHRELTERGRLRAAGLACGEGAMLSGLAAARLLGLWERPVERLDVLVPGSRCPRPPGIRVHRTTLIAPVDVTHVRGIPCTSVSRSLVDLAASPALEAVFERAERRRMVRPDVIEGMLLRRWRAPGAARLRALLETHRPQSGPTRSLLERRLLAGLRRAGLPEPVVNGSLELEGEIIQPDLMWPQLRVLVELDGLDTHGTRTAMRRDRRRDRLVALAGWVGLRFTWEDVDHDLRAVLADLGCALGAL
jgi:very-short-patch-repair endonuclease